MSVEDFSKYFRVHIDNLNEKKYETSMDAVAPLVVILGGLKAKFTPKEYEDARNTLVQLTVINYPDTKTILES